MFSNCCCHCTETCLYYEIDEDQYHALLKKFKQNDIKKVTFSSYVKKNRQNDYLNFLVVLMDKHYKSSVFHKSVYDSLLNCEFPGKIDIIHHNDLSNNEFIIKDNVVFKKLYIKSLKENLYIDALKYEDFLLNSITNEFLHVISVLKPMSIKLKIYNQNKHDIDFDVNTSISFQGFDVGNGVKNQNTTDTNHKKEWLLTFTKNNKPIDLSRFLDKNKFYYLPKNNEWLELINNRVNFNVNTANYVYEHCVNENIDFEFLQKMKFLKVDFKYKKNNYENLRFEYEIIYYPL